MKYALTIVSSIFCICLLLNSCGEKEPAAPADTSADQATPTGPDATEPLTQAPAEDPPAEDPPAEDPPAADPPAEDPPAEDPPAEDPPAADPPAPEPAGDDSPAANNPVAPASVVAFTAQLKEKGVPELIAKLEEGFDGGDENPLQMLDTFRQLNDLSDKLSTIETGNLPEGLRQLTNRFRDVTADMADHIEEMPIPVEVLTGGQEAIGPWFAEKMIEDPLFPEVMQDWAETMEELGGEMEESGSAIAEAFESYGIDPLTP